MLHHAGCCSCTQVRGKLLCGKALIVYLLHPRRFFVGLEERGGWLEGLLLLQVYCGLQGTALQLLLCQCHAILLPPPALQTASLPESHTNNSKLSPRPTHLSSQFQLHMGSSGSPQPATAEMLNRKLASGALQIESKLGGKLLLLGTPAKRRRAPTPVVAHQYRGERVSFALYQQGPRLSRK